MTRILLVDDDEDNLNLFTAVLENFQFTVKPYSDPITALLEFKPNHFDLLILDYRMPSLNGIELYKKIRDIDKSVKVMILTASHEQLQIEGSREQNKLDLKIVRKPVSVTNLMKEINSLLDTNVLSVDIMKAAI